jgi:hypothetical protein
VLDFGKKVDRTPRLSFEAGTRKKGKERSFEREKMSLITVDKSNIVA